MTRLFIRKVNNTIGYKLSVGYSESISSDYEELEYIESNGTQWIELDQGASIDMKVVWDMQQLSFTGNQASWGEYNNHDYLLCGNNSSTFWFLQLRSQYDTFTPTNTNRHTHTLDIINKKYYIDDNEWDISNITSPSTFLSNWYLFWARGVDDGRNPLIAKMYSFKIFRNNVLSMDLIPVRKKSTNEIGMYDKVNGVFYVNANTSGSDFIAGPPKYNFRVAYSNRISSEYTFVEYISSVGRTQWIDTGIVPTLDYTVECKAIKDKGYSLFGSGSNDFTFTGASNNYAYIGRSGGLGVTCNDQTVPHIWKITDRTAYCDENSSSRSTGTYEPTLTLALFGRKVSATSTGDRGNHTMYYCKIWDENNVLLRNFLPCKRNSDSVYGMFDLCTQFFYTDVSGNGFLGPSS